MSLSKATERSFETPAAATGWRSTLQTLTVLFKLRIVFLLLMAATAGMFLAAGGWPGWGALLLIWVTGGMAAAGASALNQYWERNRDGLMGRTRHRPLVNGDITDPRWVPLVGVALVLVPVLAVLPFNRPLAFFLLLGAFIYVGIYTIWLKPRTLLNIVIGGAAGSFAIMAGAAAVDPGQWLLPTVMAVFLFLWTPSHFWALAILLREDYAKAGVPMLPVLVGDARTAHAILLNTVLLVASSLVPWMMGGLGAVYGVLALGLGVWFLWKSWQLVRDPSHAQARRVFFGSMSYLGGVFLAVVLDKHLPAVF